MDIVFLQVWRDGVVRHAINAARNFGHTVHLITDIKRETGAIEWPIEKFSQTANELSKSYIHSTVGDPKVEMFCMMRWIILRDWLNEVKLDDVATLDSDVLVCGGLDRYVSNLPKFDVTLSLYKLFGIVSPGACIIRNPEILDGLSDMILSHYNGPRKMDQQMSDMRFWSEYVAGNKIDWFDTFSPINGMAMDHHLGETSWAKGSKYKRLSFRDGVPFVEHIDGYEVELVTLHCWGGSKLHVPALSEAIVKRKTMTWELKR